MGVALLLQPAHLCSHAALCRLQEHATAKAKAAPRVPAAASPVGVRKSMRFMPFDAMGAATSQDERSLNDAADASAWLLESGALF